MSTNAQKVGAMIDSLYKARAKRLDAEKKIEVMKKAEQEAKESIIRALTDAKLEGAKGKVCTAAITSTPFAQVEDITALHRYIAEDPKQRLDLLEKRASKSACMARWDDGVTVPGVVQAIRIDLSLTKAGG